MGCWTFTVMLVSFFYLSNLRSSIVVGRYDPNIDTLEDAAKYLSCLYIPMFFWYSQESGYLEFYQEVLGPEVYEMVTLNSST